MQVASIRVANLEDALEHLMSEPISMHSETHQRHSLDGCRPERRPEHLPQSAPRQRDSVISRVPHRHIIRRPRH